MIGIYKWTFSEDKNKCYIGQSSTNLERRKKAYESLNAFKVKKQPKFYAAIQKYGIDSFEYSILEEFEDGDISLEKLNELEIYWIKFYECVKLGYNLREGGKNGGKHSEESKKKNSDWHNEKVFIEKIKLRLSKKVYQIDKSTSQIIKEWNSIADVERAFNFSHCNISNVCNNKRKFAYGFIWKFVNPS